MNRQPPTGGLEAEKIGAESKQNEKNHILFGRLQN